MSLIHLSASDNVVSETKLHRLTAEMERLNELRQQVILQEQKVQKLHISEESNSDAYIESLIRIKEREIALALMRVAELTRQLEQLKLGQLDRNILSDSTSGNAQLLDQQPELVHSIIGPLSTPRAKSLSPIESSVSGTSPLSPISVEGTDKGRYNSLALKSRARDLVRSAVSARKETVDCNDNLVSPKVPPGGSVSISVADVLMKVPDGSATLSVVDVPKTEPVVNTPSYNTQSSPKHVDVASSGGRQFQTGVQVNSSSLSCRSSEYATSDMVISKDVSSGSTSIGSSSILKHEPSEVPSFKSAVKLNIGSRAELQPIEVSTGCFQNTDIRKIKTLLTSAETAPVNAALLTPDKDQSESSLAVIRVGTHLSSGDREIESSSSVPSHLEAMMTQTNASSVAAQQSSAVAVNDVDSALLVLRGNSLSSSRCQQRSSGSAVSRYDNMSSRLYGNWFEDTTIRSVRISVDSTSSPAVMKTAAFPVSSSDASAKDQIADKSRFSPVEIVKSSPTANGISSVQVSDAVHADNYNVNDSTSDDSYDSDEEDVRDFHDSEEDISDEESGGHDSADVDNSSFQHNDSFAARDLRQRHFRAIASPPPRRFPFHKPVDNVYKKAEIDSDDVDEQLADDRRVSKRSRRVTFDPFTLSLNAALEGELETLQATFVQLDNPNKTNEDGLSVLHNAVCSGCLDVLEFLINSGCDVNIADGDGWTPLHCAASSNNVDAVRLLVEHGASLMALSWYPDYETPLQKCAPDSPGFAECVLYITEMLDQVGSANDAKVFAIADYNAANTDEMSFKAGDQLTIVRQGDENEPLWWWARSPDGVEGYIPPNLVAFYKQSAARSTIVTSC